MKIPSSSQSHIIIQLYREGKLDPAAVSPIPLPTLSAYLNELMGVSDLSATTLAELASLHRSSIFRILSGETAPSRNVLLSLAFVLQLAYEEAQLLLKCGECAPLSFSRPRDAILFIGFDKKMSLGDIDDLLRACGHKGLIKSDSAPSAAPDLDQINPICLKYHTSFDEINNLLMTSGHKPLKRP